MVEDSILMVDDAGISANGTGLDPKVRSQKGHAVWEFLKSHNAAFSVLITPYAHGTQIKIILSRQNLENIKRGLK